MENLRTIGVRGKGVEMKHSFETLTEYISSYDEVWVTLQTQTNICLTGVIDKEQKVFSGKYMPCVPNSRSHSVSYDRIIDVRELKESSDE